MKNIFSRQLKNSIINLKKSNYTKFAIKIFSTTITILVLVFNNYSYANDFSTKQYINHNVSSSTKDEIKFYKTKLSELNLASLIKESKFYYFSEIKESILKYKTLTIINVNTGEVFNVTPTQSQYTLKVFANNPSSTRLAKIENNKVGILVKTNDSIYAASIEKNFTEDDCYDIHFLNSLSPKNNMYPDGIHQNNINKISKMKNTSTLEAFGNKNSRSLNSNQTIEEVDRLYGDELKFK